MIRRLGIPCGTITQVGGESSTGKTTATIQMAWNIVEPFGPEAYVLHFDEERATDYDRVSAVTGVPIGEVMEKYRIIKPPNTFNSILEQLLAVCDDKEANKDKMMYDTGVYDIYGKDKKGKDITIKLACYREVDRFIDSLRNRSDRRGPVEYIDFTDYKALPMDPVNCFEKEQTDYGKYDELVAALQLSALELAILNCYMNGMRQAEVCAELGIGRGTINHRKASIRQRYYSLYGSL